MSQKNIINTILLKLVSSCSQDVSAACLYPSNKFSTKYLARTFSENEIWIFFEHHGNVKMGSQKKFFLCFHKTFLSTKNISITIWKCSVLQIKDILVMFITPNQRKFYLKILTLLFLEYKVLIINDLWSMGISLSINIAIPGRIVNTVKLTISFVYRKFIVF